ncbi:MAG: prepilin-type N-terminal cleavage/methylation domain-containing protein [Deltaproteobacteria bacterium]|jgi:prepilin-type N-terminal cleavage/methylation domain-containing protein|nr:prepilin-type N-terminal cleavage/methylation domain-containing protein [Deltaproteobacteria bacterium]
MKKFTFWPLSSDRGGFTLLELMVIIGIVAVISLIAYPMLSGYRTGVTTQSQVKSVEALAQKARLLATNQRKPYRLVINCANPIDNLGCYLDLEEAVYDETEVVGWKKSLKDRVSLDQNLKIVQVSRDRVFDGLISLPNIYWAIFTPANQVFSDPKPFEFFLYHESDSARNSWKLTINNLTGRIFLDRSELRSTP